MLTFFIAECVCLLLLKYVPPFTTSVQMERRVQAIMRRQPYTKRYTYVPLARISPHLQHAVVAAEDARFYTHSGVDWKEVSKVAEDSLQSGEVERGASTLSQQLVKNLFLTTSRSAIRKALEFVMVWPEEWILGKQRVLELYLNVVEWGPGVYGAEAAARYHYGVSAANLNRTQAAHLAALLPAPLHRKITGNTNYVAKVMTRMSQMGW